jgi:hypothetical protein
MIKGSLLTSIVLMLAACHGDSGSTPATTATPHVKKAPTVKPGPTPQELTAGMVEAVALGKSSVPLSVKFDLPHRPTVGQPLDVVVALLPQAIGAASVAVTSSEGLQLAPEMRHIDIPAVEPSQAYRMTIPLTPTADGVQLLNLEISLSHDDSTDTRSFSVPVIVYSAADELAAAKH